MMRTNEDTTRRAKTTSRETRRRGWGRHVRVVLDGTFTSLITQHDKQDDGNMPMNVLHYLFVKPCVVCHGHVYIYTYINQNNTRDR